MEAITTAASLRKAGGVSPSASQRRRARDQPRAVEMADCHQAPDGFHQHREDGATAGVIVADIGTHTEMDKVTHTVSGRWDYS